MKRSGSIITGTGKSLPAKVLSNDYFEKTLDVTDEWIVRATGIKERRVISPGQTSADLATSAALSALKNSGKKAGEIELIIVATFSGEQRFPSCACNVQKMLGAEKAFAFDVNSACTGFLNGLELADACIKNSSYKNALIIGVEVFSRILDYTDKNTCILFGDGAGAVVLEQGNGSSGILLSKNFSSGEKGDLLFCEKESKGQEFLRMEGSPLFKYAVNGMADASRLVMEEEKIQGEDLNLFLPHQANERIIRGVAKNLGVPMEKVFMNIAKYGNTSAATIPIALAEAVEEGRIKTGDNILLTAFGAGLTWGATLIKWQ
jgi:3-oxoacyl-[acyl-carrier-protein] synthase-3